jgi:hypothetical protein
MPLNPTGSEIPRSLTQIGTTIDAALDLKVDSAAYQNAGGIDAGIWKEQLDLTGVNTGDQDLSSYATTSAVAAGYQPLDSDLTAIAALTTTSDGRALLTESTAQTGTGALVRAASPTVTGTLNAAAITATGDATISGLEAIGGSINTSYQLSISSGVSRRPITISTSHPDGSIDFTNTGTNGRRYNFGSTNDGSGAGAGFTIVDQNAGLPPVFCIRGANGLTGVQMSSPVSQLHVTAKSAAIIPLIAQGAASQTANLQEWRNSSAIAVASIDNTGNLTASGTLRVGGGTVVANILSATATLDFPSIGSNGTETLTITVTGAVAGDSVFLGCPAGLDAGLVFCASVTAADTVTVRMHNSSGGSIDPASATFRATVIRF